MPFVRFSRPVVDVFGRHEKDSVMFVSDDRAAFLVGELKAAALVEKPAKPEAPKKRVRRSTKNA